MFRFKVFIKMYTKNSIWLRTIQFHNDKQWHIIPTRYFFSPFFKFFNFARNNDGKEFFVLESNEHKQLKLHDQIQWNQLFILLSHFRRNTTWLCCYYNLFFFVIQFTGFYLSSKNPYIICIKCKNMSFDWNEGRKKSTTEFRTPCVYIYK